MNRIKITKIQILDNALDLAKDNGLEKISIRKLAEKCGVSVGCIYYYFEDKNELIVELIRKFWDEIFSPISKTDKKNKNFIDFLINTYNVLLVQLSKNNLYSNSHMNMFSKSNIDLGRFNMENYKDSVIKIFINALDEDNSINNNIWCEDFSKYDLADFIFANIFISLDKKEENIDFFCYVLEKIIY